jgi:hypothetical protein
VEINLAITAKSKVGLKKKFEALLPQTKTYLVGIESLLDEPKTFGVALAFAFMKVEEGQHRALKCGLVRIHKCNSKKVDEALGKQHFTRSYFKTVFKNVMGEEVETVGLDAINKAEKVRDKLIHGKGASQADLREAIINVFEYITVLGKQVEAKTSKNPFGDLRGLAGKTTLMDPVPSYWLLKGLGFYNEKSKATE